MNASPFLTQLCVALSPLLAALSVGGSVSFPTVLLYQLKNNSSMELDLDTSTWIGSLHGFAGIPSIFLPIIMEWRGRKFAFIAACFITLFGWITSYSASSVTALLISECLHGLGSNCILAVSSISITEMISPRYRVAYIQAYAVLQALTMAVNVSLTRYIHWKKISIIMSVPLIAAILLACFTWPESPYWLAMRGRYEKCKKAFVWLRGNDATAKNELDSMIETQQKNVNYKKASKSRFKNLWNTIKRRDFYLPVGHMFVLQYMFYWTGNFVILIYSIELIQKTTQNENTSLYGATIINSMLSIGLAGSIILERYFKRKTILLCFAILLVISMSSASLVTYLQTIGSIAKDSNLCLYCLIVYMIANSMGIFPFTYPIAAEIIPVKHRGIGTSLIIICSCVLHTSALKVSPYLFLYINLWGTFLFFGINAVICCIIICKYVPETKGRTLQELEHYYMYGQFLDENFSGCGELKPMAEEMTLLSENKVPDGYVHFVLFPNTFFLLH